MYQNIEMNKKIISQENGDLAFLMATKCLYPMATFSSPIRFGMIKNDSERFDGYVDHSQFEFG